MKKRGRIIRDTNNGPGLIGSEGSQYEFNLEGVWNSDLAPVINTVVEFELDENSKVVAITTISENQLAKEQADKALQAAKEKGGLVLNEMISRVGKPVLIAITTLVVSWFYLSTITVQASRTFDIKITFWKLLTVLNLGNGGFIQALQSGGGGDTGIYGFLAFISLLGPFAYIFWKNPKAHLGNCLPFLVMLIVGLSFYFGIQDGLKSSLEMSSAYGGAETAMMAKEMINKMMAAAMQSIHIGIGMYLSLLASSYLAFVGVTKFLASKA